jgi:hypothetical protein
MTADIINLAEYRAAKAAAATRPSQGMSVDQAIAICLEHRKILTAWERRFLDSIRHSRCELSPRQQAVMQQIFDKVCGVAEDDAS